MEKNKTGKQKLLKTLTQSVREYKTQTILSPLFVMFEVFLEVLLPLLMALIINEGTKSGADAYNFTLVFGKSSIFLFSVNDRISFIVTVGSLMVGMSMLSLFLGVLAGRFAAVAGAGFAKNLRHDIYNRIQLMSFKNIDKFNTGGLLTRLTTDVTYLQQSYMLIVRTLVRAPIMMGLALAMSTALNAELARVFLIAVPVLVVGVGVIGSVAFPRFNKMLKKYDELNDSTQENLTGIRVVKSFVRGDYETKRFKNMSSLLQKLHLKAENVITVAMPLMQLSSYACMIAIAYLGGNKIIAGEMEVGSLMAFIAYIMQILNSLMLLAFIFVMLVLSKSSAVRVVEVLNEEPEIKDNENADEIFVEDGTIEFVNVDFSYNQDKNNLHLENTTLKINSGEKIGIIGGTGSSKSTLVQLIPRLYEVTDGKVLVGGRDVKDYKLKELRDSVAMVLQKNVLFSGTIKDNLKWGNENATDEEVFEAAKAAQAHDFIMSFPDGYETSLGQGGVNVSGGQKQRLCIARALLKNPKIIILDDSTSAVDTETDKKIRNSFKKNFKDVTVLTIAQRVTSVMDADRIIVMDGGKINAVGTHKELLKTSDIYREVYQLQKQGVK